MTSRVPRAVTMHPRIQHTSELLGLFTEPNRVSLRITVRYGYIPTDKTVNGSISGFPPSSFSVHTSRIIDLYSYMTTTPILLHNAVHIFVTSSPVQQQKENVPANMSPARRKKKKASVANQTGEHQCNTYL